MADVYSKRLGSAVTTVDNTATTVGTVPAGKVWIVREWIWNQTGTGSARGRLVVAGVTGNTDLTGLLAQFGLDARTQRHVVLYAGETLSMRAQNSTLPITLTVQAYGYELDMEA